MDKSTWLGRSKSWVKGVIGEQTIGVIDLLLSPLNKQDVGKAFNGQEKRQALFDRLVRAISFHSIIETGTWRGTTSNYMYVSSKLPVQTVELNPRYYRFAKIRLALKPSIKVTLSDSRTFLESLATNPMLLKQHTFFYLDAHWNADLPLWQELDLILTRWSHAILMIDDFQVPGDKGYGYDDYGPRRSLTVENFMNECAKARETTIFFPTASSESESGARRGCAVLAVNSDLVECLKQVDQLTLYRN